MTRAFRRVETRYDHDNTVHQICYESNTETWEENGKYYYQDDWSRYQTTELINLKEVECDEWSGELSYHEKPLDDYLICEENWRA
jgi:hypothetical protein